MKESCTGSRRYTGPILKKVRSLGFSALVEGKMTKKSIRKQSSRGLKRNKRVSELKEEYNEIQKLCYLYGLSKKQLRNSFIKIKEKSGLKEYNLSLQFELRIDNILFKAGFGTRRFVRQVVSHGHLRLNGRMLNIPSYKLKVGDSVELSEKIFKNGVLKSFIESRSSLVDYISVEGRNVVLLRFPDHDEAVRKDINFSSVIRRYSRIV